VREVVDVVRRTKNRRATEKAGKQRAVSRNGGLGEPRAGGWLCWRIDRSSDAGSSARATRNL